MEGCYQREYGTCNVFLEHQSFMGFGGNIFGPMMEGNKKVGLQKLHNFVAHLKIFQHVPPSIIIDHSLNK